MVSVDTLIDAIWADAPPPTKRTQVAICVSGLRKVFRAAGHRDDVIITRSPGYILLSDDHYIDLVEFERGVHQAQRDAERGELTAAAGALTSALALWRGSALDGITGSVAELEANRLDEKRLAALEQLGDLRLQLGQHRALISELASLVHDQPLRERARAQLMLAQYRSGQRAEATETFRKGRRHFVDELGIEPGPDLQELHNRILQDDPDLTPSNVQAPPVDVTVAPAQLPPSVSFFTGRQAELHELDGLLEDREQGLARAALITGGAGVGKTGLAVHWSNRVAQKFPDGQLFADLQGYAEQHEQIDANTVLEQFLRALGTPPERTPRTVNERVALYRTLLDGKQLLIVLDNVRSFSQIRPLLPGDGRCGVIVTSRSPLSDFVEHSAALLVRLGPLTPLEGRNLFSQVAGSDRVADDRVHTNRVCELCDHLPYALRVAAASLSAKPHWTVERLAQRLETRHRRLDELCHGERTVRSLFDASYRLLDTRAACLYRRLGLLELPEFDAITGARLLNTTTYEAEDLLEQLVDVRLLEVYDAGGYRYRFVPLVQLHAWERGHAEETIGEQRSACQRVFDSWYQLDDAEAVHNSAH